MYIMPECEAAQAAALAADFPSLKFAATFRSKALVHDEIGGDVLTSPVPAEFTLTGEGMVFDVAAATTPFTKVLTTPIVPAHSYAVAIGILKYTGLDSSTSTYFRLANSTATNGYLTIRSTDTGVGVSADNPGTGAGTKTFTVAEYGYCVVAVSLQIGATTAQVKSWVLGPDGTFQTGSTNVTGTTSAPTLDRFYLEQAAADLDPTNGEFRAYYMFDWTTLPSNTEMEAAMTEMLANDLSGIKRPYSGWEGV